MPTASQLKNNRSNVINPLINLMKTTVTLTQEELCKAITEYLFEKTPNILQDFYVDKVLVRDADELTEFKEFIVEMETKRP